MDMSGEVDMLSKTKSVQESKEGGGRVIRRIINMKVEVASDDEFRW